MFIWCALQSDICPLSINPFLSSGLLFYYASLNKSISNSRMSGFLLLYFIEIHVANANRVDLDQTPRSVASAASDLGFQCLLITLLKVFRLKWVKTNNLNYCNYFLSISIVRRGKKEKGSRYHNRISFKPN